MKKVLLTTIVSFAFLNSAMLNAEEAQPRDNRAVLLIDVKDISNRTKEPVDVSGLADRLEDVLSESGMYRVITKNSIGRSIKEKELFEFLGGEKVEESKLKVPGYRAAMTILQWSTDTNVSHFSHKKKHHLHRSSQVETTVETRIARVEIMFKVTDLRNHGETVFTDKFLAEVSDKSVANVKSGRKGKSGTTGKGLRKEDVYLSKAVDKVMEDFCEKLKDIQPFHIIACSDDGELTLDVPSSIVKVGDILKVYSLGQAVVSKRTGKTTRSETEVASIRVTATNEEGSTAEFVDILTAACDWHVVVRRNKQ